MTIGYEGPHDDEKLKMVLVVNWNNNNYYVVSDSESDEESEENLFDEDFDKEVKTTPKTIINAKKV